MERCVDTGEAPGVPFGRLLRRYRASAGLTQEELAARAGVSVRALSDMERGRTARPFSHSVRLLADALELDEQARARLTAAVREGTEEAGRAGPEGNGAERHPRPEVPRQLPLPVPHFAGRSGELRVLAGLVDRAAGSGTVVISAIAGTAGVGKTALAVHWAHQVAGDFPDGQLYVNLRGFDPSGTPTAPEEAIRRFLGALGVAPERIPAGLDEQAALYRSLLASRRVLVVLDNAADERQIRPLLPGGAGNLVVVTSRSQLAGLVAIEGAHPICLDVLSQAEAWQLLAGRLGAARLAAEPDAAAELTELCARLPLALAVAAARAAVGPGAELATLVAQLRDDHSRLDVLDDNDPAASIRAVFSWSYQNLPEPAARLFRLLGVHPGPDISVPAAASLAALPLPQAHGLLQELTRCHLLAESAPGRFAFHDLLRAYAADRAGAVETEAGRAAAGARMLDHYLQTAHGAALLLSPSRNPISLSSLEPGARPEQLDGYPQAMDWFTTEHQVLLANVGYAVATGSDTHAWQLPWTLQAYLDRQGHWRDLVAMHHTALAAAERLGDLAAQAHMHRNIGRFFLTSREDSHAHLSRALELYRQLGDRDSQAPVQLDLAVLESPGRYREALDHSRQALSLFMATGNRAGQACALNAAGWCHAHLGEQHRALDCCQQALEVARGADDQMVVASIWDSLGYIRHQLGQYADAIACYHNALRLCRELGILHNQAEVLTRLGEVCLSSGDRRAARSAWQRALAILDELGHQDAVKVQANLASLTAAS
jgi:tetratricopeptide (TPR) repeat protein/transcriptional regulator with XRE-family HTH domain